MQLCYLSNGSSSFCFLLIITIMSTFFFGWMHRAARGILVPKVGVEPVPLALGVHSLSTGPPGMSQYVLSFFFFFFFGQKRKGLLY